MTQVWRNEKVVAVTKVKIDPCVVVQVKSEKTDGYKAIQVGTGTKKEKNIKKPQKGHMKNLGNFAKLKEFRIEIDNVKKGDVISIDSFASGDNVQATGISKGKGFQGVVRRHGFAGAIKTHGTKDQVRMSGSVGSTGPAHVLKGMRMGGRMGGDQVTIKNLEVVEIDTANNLLYIKGAVPGGVNGWVIIAGEGEMKFTEGKSVEGVEKIEAKAVESTEENVSSDSPKTKEENIEEVVIEADKKRQEKESGNSETK